MVGLLYRVHWFVCVSWKSSRVFAWSYAQIVKVQCSEIALTVPPSNNQSTQTPQTLISAMAVILEWYDVRSLSLQDHWSAKCHDWLRLRFKKCNEGPPGQWPLQSTRRAATFPTDTSPTDFTAHTSRARRCRSRHCYESRQLNQDPLELKGIRMHQARTNQLIVARRYKHDHRTPILQRFIQAHTAPNTQICTEWHGRGNAALQQQPPPPQPPLA